MYSIVRTKTFDKSYRRFKIKGDLLLVYQKRNKDLILVLVDLASHSYLFG